MARLYLFLAISLTLPGLCVKVLNLHPAPASEALMFGIAILGAAFLVSWAAEVAQVDIPPALAVAILALIAVLPEYAVDLYFAWSAAKDPSYAHYATANMTGANRLLVGLGWPAVVLLFALKFRKSSVVLAPRQRTEIVFLGLATCYSFVIPLKGRLDLFDAFFLLLIFFVYMRRIASGEVEEPELIGPARMLGELPPVARRMVATLLFLFSGVVIFVSAKPFAESLIATGKGWGIDEFLLVQWLAPLASEAPEFIVALIWTFHGNPQGGLGALISSKVNQWTLLVGTIPVIYSISLGHIGALHLDTVQRHELWLTAAQSLMAIALLVNLRLSWFSAVVLFVLFSCQLIFPEIRMPISAVYIAAALGLIWRDRGHYQPLLHTLVRR